MFHSVDFTQFCPLADFVSMLLGMVMAFLSLFLIMLILLQRGRGGGLAGAFGGAGGQSAFGSKAGDTFTVLTVSLAGVWILVCAFAMWKLGPHFTSTASLESDLSSGPGDDASTDAASGLVIPTTNNQENSAGDATLVPAGGEAETPAEMEPAVVPSETPEATPPADEPAAAEPATTEPASAEPATTEPAAAESTDPAVSETEPSTVEPAATELAPTDPAQTPPAE